MVATTFFIFACEIEGWNESERVDCIEWIDRRGSRSVEEFFTEFFCVLFFTSRNIKRYILSLHFDPVVPRISIFQFLSCAWYALVCLDRYFFLFFSMPLRRDTFWGQGE